MSVSTDPGAAAGETIGAVLEQLDGARPDLAFLFVAGSHVEHCGDLVAAVNATVGPGVLLAASVGGVLGGAREAERGPGVSLWAGRTGSVQAGRMEGFDRSTVLGVPQGLSPGDTLVVLADSASFPQQSLFDALPEDVAVIGGLMPTPESGGGSLWLGSNEYRDGAVAVVLPPGAVTTLVSQGCRPVGRPWVVTRSSGNLIHELGGRPAVKRLDRLVESLAPDDRRAAARGVHLGIVFDDRTEDPAGQCVLIRDVLGIERSTRAIAISEPVDVGQLVQFQVRDGDSARAELVSVLSRRGERYAGALVFAGRERGTHLFAGPDHDAAVIADAIEGGVAGVFAASELGPIGGRNAVHRSAVTVLAFRQLP